MNFKNCYEDIKQKVMFFSIADLVPKLMPF